MVSRLPGRPRERAGLETGAADAVLALGGEQSYGPQIVSMLQEFAPDVTGGSVAGCGHWMPEERPTEVTEHLLRFLSR